VNETDTCRTQRTPKNPKQGQESKDADSLKLPLFSFLFGGRDIKTKGNTYGGEDRDGRCKESSNSIFQAEDIQRTTIRDGRQIRERETIEWMDEHGSFAAPAGRGIASHLWINQLRWLLFIFYIKIIKIIVASWDTAISGWPTEQRTDSDKEQRKHKQYAQQVSSKRAIRCSMLCVHVCHETTTVTDQIVYYLFPANHSSTYPYLIWLSKGWFSRFQNWWSKE
jgi:hypothetical protein